MVPARGDGRRVRGGGGALLLPLSLSVLSVAPHLPSSSSVAALGVVPAAEPRSMDALVLGTVSLPNVPSGSSRLLDDAYERGFRRYDLARTYGGGRSEDLFGRWLQESGADRGTLRLVTKGGMGDDKYGDPDRPMCTRSSLRSEMYASLDALRTTYVDLYMLHRDDPRLPVDSFVTWLNELREEGLIRRWGVSNWSLRRARAARARAVARGLDPPAATSPQLSLAVPSGDSVWPSAHSVSCPSKAGEIDWYGRRGMEVMGWEALAKGFMAAPALWREHEVHISTFHGPDAEIGTDAWRLQRVQRSYCTPANYARRRMACRIAREGGLSLAQVALLYCLSKGEHVSVLVGAERTEHLDEMAELGGWRLDDEAVDCLTAASTDPDIVARVASEVRGGRGRYPPAAEDDDAEGGGGPEVHEGPGARRALYTG